MRLAAALLALSALSGAAQQLPVSTYTLSNGMRLLVHEDHNIPNVALYLFFKVGSRNEHTGATGLSHFFEHMMFNGAKKYGPKQFDIEMEKRGGRNNAWTNRDVTVYTDWFPPDALELMMDMEADRIRDLNFDPKIIESERGVVYSERRSSVDDSNGGALEEQLNAAAYVAHPYHWPVIGWASDIESWTMDDLKAHFRMGYAPNNCVVVASGDVSAERVAALAKKYLEPIPRHDPPPPVRTREPEQQGERRVILEKPAELPLQMFSYHVPPSSSPDYFALQVLERVLAEGRSSRLYRRLVDRDQLAIGVESEVPLSLDPGQFLFVVRPRSGVDPARTERALLEEIEAVRSKPVPDAELDKARNLWLVEFYRRMKSSAGQAQGIGEFEVYLGGYGKLDEAAGQVEKVTAAQVQEAARRYLAPSNRTVATLVPVKEETAQ
jgi:zinc protease